MATKVGQAYVEITPKLGDIGKVNSDMDKGIQGEQVGKKAGGGILSGIKSTAIGVALGNMLTAGVTAAVDGIKSIISGAFSGYADYEQLVGGVDKLYGDASGKLQQYAADAYKTAGMSANQYMEQATSFSASLIGSLNGDVDAAADMTDVAMRAMSDNVNVFGSDMQSVQDAYQGFSKGQFQMLDNLKLGYGGTQSEMQRLIDDANKYAEANGLAADLSIDSFADIVQAIQYIQEEQGIAGTTAAEAADTVSGSIEMVKASWQNLLTGLGDPDADIGALFGQLTDSLEAMAGNVLPLVGRIFMGIGEAIPMALSYVFTELPGQLLPMLEEAFTTLGENATGPLGDVFRGLGDVVQQLSPTFENVKGIADGVVAFITENMPMLQEIGGKIGEVAGIVGGILAEAINYVSGVLAVVVPMILDIASAALPAVSGALDAVIGVLTWLSSMFSGIISVVQVAIGWFAQIYEVVSPAIQAAFSAVGDALTSVGEFFATAASDAQADWQALKDWISGLPTAIINFFTNLPGSIQAKFNSAKAYMTAAMDSAKTTISAIPGAIIGFFGDIASKIGSKFEAARDAITGPIDEAKSTVSDAIDAIKEFLDVNLPHPHIPMPDFSISGEFDPLNGKLPKVSVSWNARGAFFDGATLIGAGEAGREALIPLENRRYMQPFADAVAEGIGRGEDAELVIRWLARNLGPIIADYTPTMTRRELRREVAYA